MGRLKTGDIVRVKTAQEIKETKGVSNYTKIGNYIYCLYNGAEWCQIVREDSFHLLGQNVEVVLDDGGLTVHVTSPQYNTNGTFKYYVIPRFVLIPEVLIKDELIDKEENKNGCGANTKSTEYKTQLVEALEEIESGLQKLIHLLKE